MAAASKLSRAILHVWKCLQWSCSGLIFTTYIFLWFIFNIVTNELYDVRISRKLDPYQVFEAFKTPIWATLTALLTQWHFFFLQIATPECRSPSWLCKDLNTWSSYFSVKVDRLQVHATRYIPMLYNKNLRIFTKQADYHEPSFLYKPKTLYSKKWKWGR